MSVPHHPLVLDSRRILRWVGVMGILWLLLLWKCVGFSAQNFYLHQQSQPAIPVDAHAHIYVAGDHQFSPRRTLNALSPPPLSDYQVPLVSTVFFSLLALLSPQKNSVVYATEFSFAAHQLQLATLNISRAPPAFH
ncbi:hypothetical protein [Cellvibrio sp. pealriver]|uniref:hypothetical protein n=1 Tax=Cellvibrio sp. pealriver TaxID=1622269 RepID=UPI00066FF4F2|nr:hypothetical protein [Cellvibrio sp. pealriver]